MLNFEKFLTTLQMFGRMAMPQMVESQRQTQWTAVQFLTDFECEIEFSSGHLSAIAHALRGPLWSAMEIFLGKGSEFFEDSEYYRWNGEANFG
jgi:hypothetical protein